MARSKVKVTLDSAGMEEMLKSAPVAAAVMAEAEKVANAVRADPNVLRHEMQDDVITGPLTTDRAVAYITIAHAGGMGMEAKHGTLSRAAGGVAQ